MMGAFNTFGLIGPIVDQPQVFADRRMRAVGMIKLARENGHSAGIGCHRRMVVPCGEMIPNRTEDLEPLDPVEAMGFDDFR